MQRKKSIFNHPVLTTTIKQVSAVLIALILGAVLILLAGSDPIKAYLSLWNGAFGSLYNFTEVLVKASPLCLAGLAVTLSFRAGVFNIGAEGQIFMGALMAAWIGVLWGDLPAWILLPAVLILSFIAGGIWGGIPGLLKAKLGVDEIITTIMFNYIAIWTVSYFVNGPLKDPSSITQQTEKMGEGAWLPKLIPATRLHAGIIITIILLIIFYFIINKSVFGYRARLVGTNQSVARAAGINVAGIMSLTMFISGGLAGVAGMMEVSGLHHRLLSSFSPGYGFTAVVIALLGKLNPLAVLISGFFFAALTVGANEMQRSAGIPNSLISVIQALVVIFILISDVQKNKGSFLTKLFGKKEQEEK